MVEKDQNHDYVNEKIFNDMDNLDEKIEKEMDVNEDPIPWLKYNSNYY